MFKKNVWLSADFLKVNIKIIKKIHLQNEQLWCIIYFRNGRSGVSDCPQ